jgi:hypothetical protein
MTRLAVPAAMLILLCAATPAGARFDVDFGKHVQRLQNLINSRYGKGHIDVTQDYIGAHEGDPDPWTWGGRGFTVRLIRRVTQEGQRSTVGWYEETGVRPVMPAASIVFDESSHSGSSASVSFGRTARFGFYLQQGGCAEPGLTLFTNRAFNPFDDADAGHTPGAGTPAALVFDVSRWSLPSTWVVCFRDAGNSAEDENGDSDRATLSHDGGDGENGSEFDDLVFEVSANDVTPVRPISFGALKAKYRP